MSTERSTRWTAWTALATSAIALGFSVWSLGCERNASALTKGEKTEQAMPLGVEAPAMKTAPAASKDDASEKPSKAKPAEKQDPAEKAGKGKRDPAKLEGAAADVDLKVKRLVVTTDVEGREPVAVEKLSTDKQVVAFVELANQGANEGQVIITFEQGGEPPVGHIKLSVPGEKPRWRTWGKTRMVKTSGDWEAVVTGADGTELARTKFVVE